MEHEREHSADLEGALREIGALSAGLEGQTAMTMQMHGVSPVRLVGIARDIALAALTPSPPTVGEDVR